MKHNLRLDNSERNQALVVPNFVNPQGRLAWIKQQVDQVAVQAVEEFRQRLTAVKQQSETEPASQ